MQKELPSGINKLNNLFNYLSTDFLGGPKILKFAWVINFQKAGTFLGKYPSRVEGALKSLREAYYTKSGKVRQKPKLS